MRIDMETLRKKIHFPITQDQPTKKVKGFFKIIKSWATFKRFKKVIMDYIVWCDYLKAFIFIPTGFLYDNASVPKLLNSFFKSDGLLLFGSLPHDFGYRYQGLILLDNEGFLYFKKLSRKELDLIFEKLCVVESGLPWSSKLAKKALSLAGGSTYKNWKKQGLKVVNDFEGLF